MKSLLSRSVLFSIPEPEKLTQTDHLLLITDFAGKIVFTKGDHKLLALPPTAYIHKNFFNFNFTLHSRLSLFGTLNFDLFKEGTRRSFQMEFVRANPDPITKRNPAFAKHPLKKLCKRVLRRIKPLRVSVSCINVTFQKIKCLDKKTCNVEYFDKLTKKKTEPNQKFDKFLMFELVGDSDVEDAYCEQMLEMSVDQLQQKLRDVYFCGIDEPIILSKPKITQTSAFSLYSFDDIPLPVKRIKEKDDERLIDDKDLVKKEEEYFTRSKKKVKPNEDLMGQAYFETNDFLKIPQKR